MPALRVFVLDVIVDEREVVDQLDRRPRGHDRLTIPTARLAGQDRQHPTQPLAAVAARFRGADRRARGVRPAQMVPQHAVDDGLLLRRRQHRAQLVIHPRNPLVDQVIAHP